MLEEKKPVSVWGVTLLVVGLFLAALLVSGVFAPQPERVAIQQRR